MGEDEALDRLAAHRAQDIGLGDILDRLGDDLAPTPLISWITASTTIRAFSLVSMSAISDGSSLTRSSGIARSRAMFE